MTGCGGRNGGSSPNDHHHQLHDPHKHDDDRLLMTPIGRIGGEPKVTLGIADGCADDPNQPKVTILSLFPSLLLSSSSVLSISRNDRRSLDRCCFSSSSPSMAIRRGNYNMGVEQLNCSESSHLNLSRGSSSWDRGTDRASKWIQLCLPIVAEHGTKSCDRFAFARWPNNETRRSSLTWSRFTVPSWANGNYLWSLSNHAELLVVSRRGRAARSIDCCVFGTFTCISILICHISRVGAA